MPEISLVVVEAKTNATIAQLGENRNWPKHSEIIRWAGADEPATNWLDEKFIGYDPLVQIKNFGLNSNDTIWTQAKDFSGAIC